uniref:Ubiquitin-like protein SMT3,CCR4-NOT transcription complex subunit 8 n=1 Tax=Homo sapiens TaxID=9606 RepID=UPI003F778843
MGSSHHHHHHSSGTMSDSEVNQEAKPEVKPEVKPETHINLKVSDGSSEIFFKIKKTTPLRRLMEAFAKRQGKEMDSLRFLYDGIRIQADQTPEDLDMEDNDIIEAHREQTGGSTGSGLEVLFQGPHMPAALVENSQVICEVWASNLEEEMRKIREIVLSYSYIAMDTEFPGVVVRPIGEFRSSIDYQYQLLRCNVDLLKIIQLGLTFTNEKGEYPSGINTWQFNFKFNLTEDMYSQDSIDLLANSGLQFQKHEEEGIDTLHFAELLMTSGVVLCDNVKWLSFHSGYDFGYMVKLLTDSRLPEEEHEFFHILNLFFPSIYDVKYLMKSCKNLKGGLQEVADQLDLQRIGRQHQAGSDSLLTGMAFFRMKELFFEDSIDDAKYCGRLYGLGTGVAQKQNEDVDSAQEKMSILAIINNMQQ